MRKKNTSYTLEFKREAVRTARTSGRPVSQVARELGITGNNLHKWIRQFEAAESGSLSPDGKGRFYKEPLEVRQLRKELETVRMERDILKKAIAVFSQQPK
jgi:transposase